MQTILIDVYEFEYLHEIKPGTLEARTAYRMTALSSLFDGMVNGDRSPTKDGALQNLLQKLVGLIGKGLISPEKVLVDIPRLPR